MKCPIDGADLVMTERQGIEIDYCPRCRGVWLDRGELDKIIERSGAEPAPRPGHHGHSHQQRPHHGDHAGYGHDRSHDHYHGHQGHHGGHKKHKRSSIWGELFDFD